MKFYKKITRHFLFPVLLAMLGIILARSAFDSLEDHLSEPQMTKYLFAQWFVYAGLLIFISLYLLGGFLNRFLPWKSYAGSRFLLQMLLGTAISLFSINIVYRILREQMMSSPADISQVILLNIYGAAFILPIFSLFFGYKFLKDWRKSELESEQLMKENARSQLMSLKNHLDPHFLFNNLNILSSLMDKDHELSKTYLNKFAEVYRVILKTDSSDLTTLDQELELIESYVYLISIRFKDCVYFKLDVDKEQMRKALPPLTVQMLVENAIKHNVATLERPITISIVSENGNLIVKNNMQKKKYLPREREASGLENIRKRYEFFTDKKPGIVETEDEFIVILPLIEIEYAD